MRNKIIKKLKKLNKKALKNNDVPVSCIIVKNKKIIASAYNKKNKKNNPFAHAEILAIQKAAKKLKTYNLNDCELYVSLYPCNMCKEVINEARIKNIYYILNKNKNINNTAIYKKMECYEYIDFSKELSNFFINKR